jgi:DNA-binding HxlR family transcriptional regulator
LSDVDENDELGYVTGIASVMKHAMRLKTLMAVGDSDGPINPLAIAKGNEWSLNVVANHVRTLKESGAIELAGTSSRGGRKHYYQITPFGEEVLAWARKMERYGRRKPRERTERGKKGRAKF